MAQETEAKFYLKHPDALRQRIEAHGGVVSEPRVHELNLRFDTPNHDLRQGGRVLRLRQDTRARLTYKDPDQEQTGSLSRREVEFAVSDFDAAREFLEALGYEVAFIYEKYRTTYKLDQLEVMLDEMPYGQFVELEGEASVLRPTAEKLGLNWETSITLSYSNLFESLRVRRNLDFRDLTFDNLRGLQVSAAELGVRPADE